MPKAEVEVFRSYDRYAAVAAFGCERVTVVATIVSSAAFALLHRIGVGNIYSNGICIPANWSNALNLIGKLILVRNVL